MSDFVGKIAFRGAEHELAAGFLELRDVTVSYDRPGALGGSSDSREAALLGVSFRAEAGEQIAVVGPNGAGKSTLFRVIAGLMKPERGEVWLFGQPPDRHICIAYVPQRSRVNLSFPATVEDVVMMGRIRQIGPFRRPGETDRVAVRACLDRVNALHLAGKSIGELSAGQQQRVFIARALALETELLLLDEPLTGIDLPSQEQIFKTIADLRGDGVTVFMATHDLNQAGERFDRVMLLNRRIVAFGSPAEVLTEAHLFDAYGGHIHRLGEGGALVVDDHFGNAEGSDELAA
ncbi:MAG TPA: metal ABC transporter ATP-binding protein [Anaerolineales bacterium]|nr:metal ABC transporter ATP-binding protein [Anaerolineales bacterium]